MHPFKINPHGHPSVHSVTSYDIYVPFVEASDDVTLPYIHSNPSGHRPVNSVMPPRDVSIEVSRDVMMSIRPWDAVATQKIKQRTKTKHIEDTQRQERLEVEIDAVTCYDRVRKMPQLGAWNRCEEAGRNLAFSGSWSHTT